MKFIRNFLPFLFLAAFFACEPDTIEKIEFSTKAGRDVLVICEGQFNNMNAGITYINLDADTLVLDIYSKINFICNFSHLLYKNFRVIDK